MQAIHTFRSASERDDIVRKLCQLPIPRDGFDLFIRRHKVHRTPEQNKRLQWLCGLHAGWLNAKRLEFIAAGTLPKFFPATDRDAVRHQIFNPSYCGTDSSTKPSKLDMVDAITRYQVDLQELGIEIPEKAPDDEEVW